MSEITKQHRFGWYLYDWANSAFSAVVVTVFLSPYLTNVAKRAAGPDGLIDFLGMQLSPNSYYPLIVTISVVIQVLLMPFIGSWADASGKKRSLLAGTAVLGSLSTVALFMLSVDAGNYIFGGCAFIAANVFFGASIVVYNAFLPALSSPAERDKVSARGWAVGYLGGGLLLLANLMYYQSVESSHGDEGLAVRIILASAGIWWLLFTIPSIKLMPKLDGNRHASTSSLKQLKSTFVDMLNYKQTLIFLCAYLFYNDAVQTVITLASAYGTEELHLPLSTLTTAILLVQFVAIGGALLFERIAAATTTKRAIVISILLWIGVLIAAYSVVRPEHEMDFFILAAVIAIVMGGVQALSRSQFSRLIPKGKEAEYFAFYEISDKGSSWIGPLLVSFMLNQFSSYRPAILSLTLLLVIGLLLLSRFRPGVGEKAVA